MTTRPHDKNQTLEYTQLQQPRYLFGVTADAWSQDAKLSTWEGEGGAVSASRRSPMARAVADVPAPERRSGELAAAGIAALSEAMPVHEAPRHRREILGLPARTTRPRITGSRPPVRRRIGRA
jgi:hypothetical protein